MDSITKRELNLIELERVVKEAFGNNVGIDLYEALLDGWFNSLYLITLSNKMEVVLKIFPHSDIKILRYEKNIMKTEVEVLRRMKQENIVPVPEVLFYNPSGTIIDNEYYFMEKISGTPYNKIKSTLSEQQREKIEVELGRYNRKINDIKGDKFGYYADHGLKSKKWSEAFGAMVADVLEDGKEYEVRLPLRYDQIYELLMQNKSVFDLVKVPHLVHWDLHDGNVFVDTNGKITGIIDFERTVWGDPLMEVYFGNFFERKNFCKGYGSILPDSPEEKFRRVTYNVYLYLILVIECKYRGYNDEGHKKWVYDMLEKELYTLKALY